MAYNIKVRDLKEPVCEPNDERARKIISAWDLYREGKANNSTVDIATWHGSLSDIAYFNVAPKEAVQPSQKKQINYEEIELSPEQRELRRKMFDTARQEFIKKGIFKGKGKGKYQLKRSELNKYKQTHGVEYPTRDDVVIIED